ncbi:hypothetical protein QNH36_14405 [Mesobacillus sp. AQ2]|jgi:hypothetical protein|uniref:hypothetical protein n=1 Tax=Mesobacillus sp. AQ2 TaxID=3043332 RepID=UPI0024C1891E|nr:hypothetical protein [Mesobacillus sp. AQ2]WHX38880.1 hypothetical protein QNH36_14405 [Mesobacillus sp. AQ2]
MSEKGEFQSNDLQYKMPDALKKKKDFVYRVGYTSSTGNQTNNEKEPIKRSDL